MSLTIKTQRRPRHIAPGGPELAPWSWESREGRFKGITVQMSCPEYLRLRQHYELALRRWAHVEWSSRGDTPARLALAIRETAMNERNAARNRMCLHEQNCPVCNRRRKPHDPKVG